MKAKVSNVESSQESPSPAARSIEQLIGNASGYEGYNSEGLFIGFTDSDGNWVSQEPEAWIAQRGSRAGVVDAQSGNTVSANTASANTIIESQRATNIGTNSKDKEFKYSDKKVTIKLDDAR